MSTLAVPVPLVDGDVHVWEIALDGAHELDALARVLDDDERTRASRFHFERDRRRFIVAHARLREILARYAGASADALRFRVGANGKPSLVAPERLHFNLSHAGEVALVAVALRPVGVDVERHDYAVECLDLAQHFFSPNERDALHALAHDPESVVLGFFNAWSRKEAYLKATGVGVTEGLHHFDVTLAPGQPAHLLRDATAPDALARWTLTALDVPAGYAGALVAESPLGTIHRFRCSDV